MSLFSILMFLLGFVLLLGGAELLVRGASRLAAAARLSPLVIGLTVVAFGTSSPELAVNIQSAYSGQADLAVGNIVGSNIFNILLILGVCALITPLVVSRQLVRLDVPLMIGASLLMLALSLDGVVSRLDGSVLVVLFISYSLWTINESRKENARTPVAAKVTNEQKPGIVVSAFFVVLGLGLLVLGSHWLVDGAVILARLLGLSELIIGLTIVAVGTSMPEVATSIVASIRGERDIAVGNVVGSNIFNILSVLGITSVVAPNGIPISPAALSFDIPVMIAVAVACLPVFFHQHSINRWEGALFLGYFLAYTAYLFLDASGHDYLPYFSAIMLWFVIPLTVITVLVVVARFVRKSRSALE
jgi:cation:H+ antiporter